MKWLILYLVFMNIFGFCLMGVDKRRARKHAWRLPESQLFAAALLGGSIGSIVGMHVFRHKTKHWYFVWGMPAIFIMQAVAAAAVAYRMW